MCWRMNTRDCVKRAIFLLNFVLLVALASLASAGMSAAADFEKGLKAAQSGDMKTALKEWAPLAAKGHAQAQFNLGVMYHTGKGVEKDLGEAYSWFLLAAEQGLPQAQNHVGYFLENGIAVSQDHIKAASWYRLAAKQGYWTAQENLGGMYLHGKGVPKSGQLAAMWAAIATINGSYKAEALLNEVEKQLSDSEKKTAWELAVSCIEESYLYCN